MRHLFQILIILSLVSPTVTQGQFVTWERVNGAFNEPVIQYLNSSPDELFVVTSKGIYRSHDNGDSYEMLYTSAANPIRTFFIESDSSWYAVSNAVYRSEDRGRTWQLRTTSRSLTQLFKRPDGTLLGFISTMVFRTTDDGATWTPWLSQPIPSSALCMIFTSQGALLAGSPGKLYRKAVDSSAWVATTFSHAPGSVRDFTILPTGDIVAAADSGIYRSNDDGRTWVKTGSSPNQISLSDFVGNEVLSVDKDGLISQSTNGGLTWGTLLAPYSPASASQIHLTPEKTTFLGLSSSAGAPIQYGDCTNLKKEGLLAPWRTSGKDIINGAVTGISSIGESVFAGVRNVGIFRLRGGNQWENISRALPSQNVRCLDRIDTLLLAGLSGYGVYFTSDSKNWIRFTNGMLDSSVQALRVIRYTEVFAGTSTGAYKGNLLTLTWDLVTELAGKNVTGFSRMYDGVLFAAASDGIYRSTDEGEHWTKCNVSTASSPTVVEIVAPGTFVAGTASSYIYRTTNNGESWDQVISSLNNPHITSFAVNQNNYLYCGTFGGVHVSTDGGVTWSLASTLAAEPDFVNCIHLTQTDYLYRGTEAEGVFRSTESTFTPLPSIVHWMDVGSFQDWFVTKGFEFEHSYQAIQQLGAVWPAEFNHQDMRVSRALWLGARNFVGSDGELYPYKVVHIGPRVDGTGEFFPVRFEAFRKFEPTRVYVERDESRRRTLEAEHIDTTLIWDKLIEQEVNTALGITITRRMMQTSQQYHDNYIITQYVLRNTGNVNYDPFMEIPGRTVEGVYLYHLYRYAINRQVRYLVNNSSGWGYNTMLDARGVPGIDPADTDLRVQFAWHGRHPNANTPPAENIGAPIWNPGYSSGFISIDDSVGRLGAPQFIGMATLFASISSVQPLTDDNSQPSTTSWEGSDDPLTSNNSQFNKIKMEAEYTQWIERGHKAPRHAWTVEPGGNFTEPTGNPGLLSPGGFSIANGYGPYTLAYGDSVIITVVEAANGLTRAEAIEVGKKYKQGLITTAQKNSAVIDTGRSRLFATFERARAAFDAGFNIPQPPLPPSQVSVTVDSPAIKISWEVHPQNTKAITAFEVYRRIATSEEPFERIAGVQSNVLEFRDTTCKQGIEYFYAVACVGDSADNDGGALTPPGALRSGLYYTMTWIPIKVGTISGVEGEPVVPLRYELSAPFPNPFNAQTTFRYSVPREGELTIRVYDILGREVAQLVSGRHMPGVFTAQWNAEKSASGIYIVRMETPAADPQAVKVILMK